MPAATPDTTIHPNLEPANNLQSPEPTSSNEPQQHLQIPAPTLLRRSTRISRQPDRYGIQAT